MSTLPPAHRGGAYLELCPNGRIPAIVDRDNGDFPIFESEVIMLCLAKEFGQLMTRDDKGESRVTRWLMFRMGGIGLKSIVER